MPYCYRKGDYFQDPRLGSCLTFGKELSKEIRELTKRQSVLGRGTQAGSEVQENPGKQICHVASCLRFYVDGISFQIFFGQSL